MNIEFYVPGKPVPQGSKRWLPEGRMIEANKELRPWRATVTAYTLKALRAAGYTAPIIDPVLVTMDFTFTRPKSHYGTGRNAGKVKDRAPSFMPSQPDLDKLIRAVNDAITDAGLWQDDSQVVAINSMKSYAEQPGVTIRVTTL